MASPAKRARSSDAESEVVSGYLHNVSPVKVSRRNTRYFEASVQTGREEYRRVVCFSPEKRAACVQASENKQAVKLIECRKAISQSDAGGFDVLVSARSRVEAAVGLPFGHRELRSSEKKTVAEILSLGPRQKVGSVGVKVVQATSSQVVPLQGEPMEVAEFAVCDPTGQIRLSVWGSQIVSVREGQSYLFEGLATRKQGDVTVLTTTPTSVISPMAEVREPPFMTPVTAAVQHRVRGQVTGVQIWAKPRCRRCQAKQQNVAKRISTHRCEGCGLLQLTKSYQFNYGGVLIVEGDGPEFSGTLTHSALFKYVRDNSLSASAHDASLLEEHIIGQGEVEVSTNGEGLVLDVAPWCSPEPVAGAAEGGQGGSPSLDLEELFDESDQ